MASISSSSRGTADTLQPREAGRGHADDLIPVPNSSLALEPHESHVILLFSCYSFVITLDNDNILN